MTRNEQEALFTSHLGIVKKLIMHPKYLDSAVTNKEDLYQTGCEGLWMACLKYNKNRKNQFSTFAWHVIKNHLHNYYKARTNYYRNMPNHHISINVSKLISDAERPLTFLEFLVNQDQKRREHYNRQIIDLTSIIDNVFDGADKELIYNHVINGYKITELRKISKYKSVRVKSNSYIYSYVTKLSKVLQSIYDNDNQVVLNS